MSNISDWLSQIGLSQYAKSFVANDVTLELLPNLTADDLKDLGVTSVGHRRTLLRAIENLTQGDAVADAPVVPRTPHPTGPPTSEAERRRLTVLFCDLAGSTRLAGRLDPEMMRDVLVTYQNTVAGEIGRVEGHLAKFVGDGVLAYFGYPKAHEDDAERAIRAGIAIAKAVARLATPNKEALAVRIGIASGLVVVGETIGTGSALERSVVGETPNLAARLQSIAAPGQVVISAETRRLIADVFRLDDLGHLDLKGFDGKVRAFHVLGEGQAESRFEAHQTSDLGPMVGRDQELSLLLDRWRQAKAGEGQMVLLLGEAGIGKSRLTRGIIDAVASETHYRLLYQCSPFHTDSALYPVSQRLVRAARLAPDDSSEAALDKLEHALALGLDDVPPAAALLAPVLGLVSESRYGKSKLSPPQQRTRTLEVLASHLIGLSRRRPVLFVFEDAHWIDPTSLELLDFCLDRVATAPILMVVTARLTFEHRFGGHPIVTRLSLNRLGRDQARTIAERITAGRMLPGEVIQLIAARTDGVPLFVEELTKTIIESGALREVGGTLVLERPLTDIAVPASLHDSLMARLDRHPGLKEVAQFAACIGRDFGYPLLAAGCAMQESALCEALKLLASAELVFARGTPPDAAYVFKHALVRDAAYESLLKAQRRRIHARIADILEKQFPHLAANSPEVLAQHHSGAGHEDAAAHWWYVAGQRAIARSANKEALTSLTKALAILDLKPRGPNVQDIELDILIALASVATAVHGYTSSETAEIVMRARKACRNSEDVNRTVLILYSVWSTYAGLADYETCREITLEMLDVSKKRDTSRYRFLTSLTLGYEHLCLGQFILAERHLRTSLIPLV
jgi:class 3 adenylate cyclase